MPFRYSCFISYRHTEFEQQRRLVRNVIGALKGELDTATDLDAFLDEDRLQGGQYYKEALAMAVCESVCMVALYWPTYFSLKNPFCSREYKLMERLEAECLRQLSTVESQNGLIIVITLKDFDQLPKEIRDNRLR